jgi:hypothetical protein
MKPKQPSSIRVDTGFMLRLTLNAELDNTSLRFDFRLFGNTVDAQHENDGKGCRGYENCEWYKTSCQEGLVLGSRRQPYKQRLTEIGRAKHAQKVCRDGQANNTA